MYHPVRYYIMVFYGELRTGVKFSSCLNLKRHHRPSRDIRNACNIWVKGQAKRSIMIGGKEQSQLDATMTVY
jgi:hypothetical protein